MIIQIRGTNGSGKTTLAKRMLPYSSMETVDLAKYQTLHGADRFVTGVVGGDVCLVGSYKTACGGMDTIKTFALSRVAIRHAMLSANKVVCEGVLASTVAGSWLAFARDLEHEGEEFKFVYLQTPLDVCLARIQARNGGKAINERLVADKVKAIAATRKRVMEAGLQAYDLPYQNEYFALKMIMNGEGEPYRAQ